MGGDVDGFVDFAFHAALQEVDSCLAVQNSRDLSASFEKVSFEFFHFVLFQYRWSDQLIIVFFFSLLSFPVCNV